MKKIEYKTYSGETTPWHKRKDEMSGRAGRWWWVKSGVLAFLMTLGAAVLIVRIFPQ